MSLLIESGVLEEIKHQDRRYPRHLGSNQGQPSDMTIITSVF